MSNNLITYETHNGNEVKLTPSVVEKFIKSGNSNITHEEAVSFMMLAKHNKLDPFLNEVYLVKFGNKPAQMITSKEAFMKRAETNKHFKGFKAGIIVEKDGEMIKRDGALKMKNEVILGAWCEVYRDDRDVSTYVEIDYEEFSKEQATWKQQPANMIRKTAVVNGLREAFPNSLGAMYTEDDKSPQDVAKQAEKVEVDDTTASLLNELHQDEPTEQPQIVEDTVDKEAEELLNEVENGMKEAEQVEVVNDEEQGELFKGRTVDPNE